MKRTWAAWRVTSGSTPAHSHQPSSAAHEAMNCRPTTIEITRLAFIPDAVGLANTGNGSLVIFGLNRLESGRN
jgi:hypothetical protein